MQHRDDVESITTDKEIIIKCLKCRKTLKVFPIQMCFIDSDQLTKQAHNLADLHQPLCSPSCCLEKCPKCHNPCLRDPGHNPGHYCCNNHQWGTA